MKLTNHLGLPEPLVRAIARDSYVRGTADLTVTELIAPPRQVALLREHRDTLEEDAADCIFRLFGKAIHEILKQSAIDHYGADEEVPQNVIVEERLSMPIAGWTVSGQLDHFVLAPTGRLDDWKITSVWSVLDGIKEEHEAQLNCYAHLLRSRGYDVNGLQVVAILRDWSKLRAQREPDYPQTQVLRLPGRLWTPEETQAFMETSVGLHRAARTVLPSCTAEERWERPTRYAVMKAGAKRALKLFDTAEDAALFAQAQKANVTVETRPGEAVRCAHYCGASAVCTQWIG